MQSKGLQGADRRVQLLARRSQRKVGPRPAKSPRRTVAPGDPSACTASPDAATPAGQDLAFLGKLQLEPAEQVWLPALKVQHLLLGSLCVLAIAMLLRRIAPWRARWFCPRPLRFAGVCSISAMHCLYLTKLVM